MLYWLHLGSKEPSRATLLLRWISESDCDAPLSIGMIATLQFALNDGQPVGASIPATEHSVMTAWTSERQAIENMIEAFGTGFFACVMDSYDYEEVCSPHMTADKCTSSTCFPQQRLFWGNLAKSRSVHGLQRTVTAIGVPPIVLDTVSCRGFGCLLCRLCRRCCRR